MDTLIRGALASTLLATGKRGTVAHEDETGIDVDYQEDINDNNDFFAKLQPLLAKGESGGRDSITLSDWLARQMYDLGYLYELDKSELPNVEKNLLPSLQHPAADPNREFTVPWALEWMNCVHHPQVQADIAEWVNYVTPVSGVKEILAKRDPALARNQRIFPSSDYTRNCTFEPVLDGAQGEQVTKAFETALNG